MQYVRSVLGEIDIEATQETVFGFDWSQVEGLQPDATKLPNGRDVWLTSFWGFDPSKWGCIGFADESKRSRFLRQSKAGSLVAVYVTKGKGPDDMRGNVVGVLESDSKLIEHFHTFAR
jgi:hypothetical protein